MATIIAYIVSVIVLWVANSLKYDYIGYLVIPAIVLVSLFFLYDVYKNKKTRRFNKALVVGYVWRLLLVIFDLYGNNIYQLPNSGADSYTYYYGAALYAKYGYSGRGGAFSQVMGTLFKAIGPNRLFGQYTVMLFSIVSLLCLAFILYDSNISEIVKSRTMWIVALLPNFAIISSIFLRESIVCMFISLSLYFFIKWFRYNVEYNFLIAIAMAFIGAWFHSGSVAVAAGYIVVRIVYDKKLYRITITPRTIFVATIFILIFSFVFINYGDVFFEKMTGVDNLSEIANTNTEGGSSYAAYVGDSSSPISMIIYTIPRILYFLFSPFPWQWRGLSDIIAFCFSSLFYLATTIDVIKYVKKDVKLNRTEVLLISIVALCAVFVFAWGVSNTGTAARHRDKLIIIFAVLYALTHPTNKGIKFSAGRKRIF